MQALDYFLQGKMAINMRSDDLAKAAESEENFGNAAHAVLFFFPISSRHNEAHIDLVRSVQRLVERRGVRLLVVLTMLDYESQPLRAVNEISRQLSVDSRNILLGFNYHEKREKDIQIDRHVLHVLHEAMRSARSTVLRKLGMPEGEDSILDSWKQKVAATVASLTSTSRTATAAPIADQVTPVPVVVVTQTSPDHQPVSHSSHAVVHEDSNHSPPAPAPVRKPEVNHHPHVTKHEQTPPKQSHSAQQVEVEDSRFDSLINASLVIVGFLLALTIASMIK